MIMQSFKAVTDIQAPTRPPPLDRSGPSTTTTGTPSGRSSPMASSSTTRSAAQSRLGPRAWWRPGPGSSASAGPCGTRFRSSSPRATGGRARRPTGTPTAGRTRPAAHGGGLDDGMVNMARFEAGKLAEMWLRHGPAVELQQMGVAPTSSTAPLTMVEQANLAASLGADRQGPAGCDNATAFSDTVDRLPPPQVSRRRRARLLEVHRFAGAIMHALPARAHDRAAVRRDPIC